ncbi:MAG: PIG-L family deacetylase [Verrucomicrobiota bacterium]
MPSNSTALPLLAFGAHPDDIEFGCGGIVAHETRAGRPAHLVVCSRGESGTRGTPAQRTREAKTAAKLLGATLEFLALDGDAHLEIRAAHALKLAAIIRRVRPAFVLAPSTVENQHPDHWRLGVMVRDAARLARYGGVKELRRAPPHAIGQLFFYAVTPDTEQRNVTPVFIDISDVQVPWLDAMQAHQSQLTKDRPHHLLQISRASILGQRLGVPFAQALWPNDPQIFGSLAPLARAARHF